LNIFKHKFSPLILLILISFIFFWLRVWISKLALHVDLLSNAEWGEWIFFHGTKGFYENNVWTYSWPTQPPLASYLLAFERHLYFDFLETFRNIGHFIVRYHLAPGHLRFWFAFTLWFDKAKVNSEIAFPIGYFMTMKLLPIIADIIISGIIYIIPKNKKRGLIFAIIYLVSPFSWYLSALWGQTDQLAFLPLIIAFLLESKKKYPILSVLLLVISISAKPTSLIMVPLFIFLYLKNKHRFLISLGAITAAALFFVLTTKLFTDSNVFIYMKEVLYPKIFLKAELRVSTNAFNFWRIIIGNNALNDMAILLFLPARIWGIFFWSILNVIAIKQLKTINLKNVANAFFIVAAGSWLFMTNMLDRYYFAGIAGGLIVTLFYPKLLKYWLILSVIFFLNLYNQWWFPRSISFLQSILTWNEGIATRILAIGNVACFIAMVHGILDIGKNNKSK
jgi:Gpi18-like mannosyltransferase